MITVKNVNTNEVVNLCGVKNVNGQIMPKAKKLGKRFIEKHAHIVKLISETDETQTFALCENWVLAKVARVKPETTDEKPTTDATPEKPTETPKPRKRSRKSSATTTTATDTTPTANTETTPETTTDATTDAATETPTAEKPTRRQRSRKPSTTDEKPTDADTHAAEIINALREKYGQTGADMFSVVVDYVRENVRTNGNVSPEDVRAEVENYLNELGKTDAAKVKAIKRNAAANDTDGVACSDFDEICDYVAAGQPVYMYGAAGCGKSYTAEQIARRLGLDFYCQSQVLFAHDVKGYGDANGMYQETPFFKAFTKGGLFFIDEMDASAPEALVVMNTAIANRRYDFPIIGNVEAHPNFRIIAAGNTALSGADVEYTARSVQDASTINRFSFFEMKYEKNVELPVMCKGDNVLYDFICDLRNAIKAANVSLCVSYRQSQMLSSDLVKKYGRAKALLRNVFAGRDADEVRIIHGQLKKQDNAWADAMRDLFK